jgi:hypothetical protein
MECTHTHTHARAHTHTHSLFQAGAVPGKDAAGLLAHTQPRFFCFVVPLFLYRFLMYQKQICTLF